MTREEAIERFENQLKGTIAVLDSGFGTYPGESNRLYRDRKEMAQFAIAALQEQEKRERGCEYCNEDRDGYRKMFGAFSITNQFHGNVWNLETRHCKPRQIYFCPMCGRMLTEPPKGE